VSEHTRRAHCSGVSNAALRPLGTNEGVADRCRGVAALTSGPRGFSRGAGHIAIHDMKREPTAVKSPRHEPTTPSLADRLPSTGKQPETAPFAAVHSFFDVSP